MPGFNTPDGDLVDMFLNITDTDFIDRWSNSGRLWVWGLGTSGLLGDNTAVTKSSPVQTVAANTNWKSATGGQHVVALKTDGTLWLWGDNAYGAIGNNLTIGASYSSPVQTVAGGTTWANISAGLRFTTAVKSNGSLWTWGQGTSGQLGDSTIVAKSSPIQIGATSFNWKSATAGAAHVIGLKTDGTIWSWGVNSFGQLGSGTTAARSSPVQIGSDTTWAQLANGNLQGNSGAIKTDGTLWMWGANSVGQLGTGDQTLFSSPVQTIAGGTNWKYLDINGASAAMVVGAIKSDGTLWVWGSNSVGQLGTGDQTPYSSPIQTIAGGTNWKQVAGGNAGTMMAAIKSDGTLWVWGNNASYGQLGTSSTTTKFSSPVQTIHGGTNWKSVGTFSNGCAAAYFYDVGGAGYAPT